MPANPAQVRASTFGGVARDLTYAVRLLRRSPGVVTVTVLGLGLAIGVSTAVFGLVNAVAFRPTGIVDPASSVRVALGASGRDVMRLLLGDSLRPVLFGLAGGVFVALLGGRVLAGTLYGIGSADPLSFGAAVLVLLTAATAAVIFPTRRAARVDPASVLRQL